MQRPSIIRSVLLAGLLALTPSLAVAGQTRSVPVTVDLPQTLTLKVTVRELIGGVASGPDLGTTMNFGALVRDGLSAQRGSRSFAVLIDAAASGRAYTITGTMPPPASGANTLPNATALKITGATRNGADIAGDSFNANAQTAVMSNSVIYTSSGAGDSALVSMTYGISGANPDGSAPFPGWVGVPPDFPGGDYSSTVSYSLVLV